VIQMEVELSAEDYSSSRHRLRSLIAQRAIERKPDGFKLASGRISTLYIDIRKITQEPEGIKLIGSLILAKIKEMAPEADAVGGLETGAIPISTAVCMLSSNTEKPLVAFWVRKSVKDHGLQNRIEGNLRKGAKAVIVEDTFTTGGSSIQAAQVVKEQGADVVLAIGIVDRGAAENFRKAGIPFFAIFSEAEVAES
jgi:orotate phosphoribosyltransferase